MFNRLTSGVRASSPRPAPVVDYRILYAGDSNVHSGYATGNRKMKLRPQLIMGIDPAWASDDAVSGQRIDQVIPHLESQSPPVSERHPASYIKLLIVGTGTNDFYNSPRDSVAQLVADYQAINTFYNAIPGFIVIPMTTFRAAGNMDLIDAFRINFMAGYTGYGFGHVIDAYNAVSLDNSELIDSVHLNDKGHIKASWLIAAAIDDVNLGINRLPVTYWVLNKPVQADNIALYNAIRSVIATAGYDNPPRIDNGDGVRIALRVNPEVLRAFNAFPAFQGSLKTAFGDLEPLNQLIDVLTAADTPQIDLPSGDGWPPV